MAPRPAPPVAAGPPRPPGTAADAVLGVELTALTRRVAALERQAGIVPGLLPPPGGGPATTTGAARATPAAPDPGPSPWLRRGQAAVPLVLVAALLAWLLLAPAHHAPPAPPAAAPAPPTATPCPVGGSTPCSLAVPARPPGPPPAAAVPPPPPPIDRAEQLPIAGPGLHCGVVRVPAGQVCDQEGLRLHAPLGGPDEATPASGPH